MHSRLSTGEPFYVGKGSGRRATSLESRRAHWRNIVAKDGGRYVNIIAHNLDEDLAFLLEMEAIDKYRRLGVDLANRTNGGDGPTGYKFTEAQRRKLSARPITPEWRAKMSASAKGRRLTPEQRAAMSTRMSSDPRVKERRFTKSMKGFVHSAESRAKMSSSMKGRTAHNNGVHVTEEERIRLTLISRNRIRSPLSEDTKRKISAAQKGRQFSQEARERMSKAGRVPVQCVETGEIFESAMAASLWLGLNQKTQVGACCTGRLKHVRGFTFRHAEKRP
jgi:hypothetical protein